MAPAGGSLGGFVSVLETHRGRDRVVRLLGYSCQLAGGVLVARNSWAAAGSAGPSWGHRLLRASEQLSHSRTVLRLLDDLPMLGFTCRYGLGPQEEDPAVRCLSLLSNFADQLYYPCEHLAWAADADIIRAPSATWWALSTALWAASLLLGAARSLRILAQLRKKLEKESRDSEQKIRAQAKAELLTVLSNLADLCNAIHWLPPGILWAGKSPPWLVGLMGTVSSLLGIYQAYGGGSP